MTNKSNNTLVWIVVGVLLALLVWAFVTGKFAMSEATQDDMNTAQDTVISGTNEVIDTIQSGADEMLSGAKDVISDMSSGATEMVIDANENIQESVN